MRGLSAAPCSTSAPTGCLASRSRQQALPSSLQCRRGPCPLPQLVQPARQALPAPCRPHEGALRCSASEATAPAPAGRGATPKPPAPLKVVIAGAGISGLSLAMGLLNKGYEVVVLERDLTAIRGEGKYRGPIQVRARRLCGAAQAGVWCGRGAAVPRGVARPPVVRPVSS